MAAVRVSDQLNRLLSGFLEQSVLKVIKFMKLASLECGVRPQN